jgi:hypothetical protein
VLGSAVAALGLVALALALPGAGLSTFVLRLAELLLAGGAAYLLDDGAAQMTTVTSRSLWRRRAPALAGGVTVLVAAWAGILLLLRWQESSLPAIISGEVLVLATLAVAVASVLVYRGEPQPGGQVAPLVGVGGLSALIAEPVLRASIFLPVDDAGEGARLLPWVGAGCLALVVILVAARDPASRWGG